jgi:polyisoprenoid-binding protein YceI
MHSTTDIPTATVAGTWVVDPGASSVAFAIKHLKVATVHGRFERFTGTVRLAGDLSDGDAAGAVELDSVATGDDKRDEVLRGEEFFAVDAFPEMTFAATGFRHRSGRAFELEGELRIRDVAQPVVFAGEVGRVDGQGELRITARGKVDRTRFGMPFDHNASSALLGKQVTITLTLTLRRDAEG